MKRVALYVRVSTEEQALHGDSIETQKKALIEYAKKENLHIVNCYADEGFTATNLNRPSLKKLLLDIENGLIDLIIFTKIDRWSRGVRNYYKLQDILDKHKVDWKTIFENYDTSTASGRLHINIMLSVAENESAQTSERIKAVFKNKLSKGEVCSGKVPRGYKIQDKHLVIDEESAPMIRDIFDFYENNNSLSKLVSYIKENYSHIHYVTVKRILTNPLYIGKHKDSDNHNFCDPIITEKQFYNVQRLLKNNIKTYKSKTELPPFIFSGLLVCKECGHKLIGNRQIKKNKKIGKYYYSTYRCQHHFKEKTCTNNYNCPEINKLEKYLLENVKDQLEKYITSYKINSKNSKKNNNVNNINIIKNKLGRLTDLYLDELITKDEFKEKYEHLNSKLKKLESEKIEVVEKSNLESLEKFLKLDFNSIYNSLNNTEKRTLWMSVIDKIFIGKDKSIEIKFL